MEVAIWIISRNVYHVNLSSSSEIVQCSLSVGYLFPSVRSICYRPQRLPCLFYPSLITLIECSLSVGYLFRVFEVLPPLTTRLVGSQQRSREWRWWTGQDDMEHTQTLLSQSIFHTAERDNMTQSVYANARWHSIEWTGILTWTSISEKLCSSARSKYSSCYRYSRHGVMESVNHEYIDRHDK